MKYALALLALITMVFAVATPAYADRDVPLCMKPGTAVRLFKNFSPEMAQSMRQSFAEACDSKLSLSQIAGRVIKSCIEQCNSAAAAVGIEEVPSKASCKSRCLTTVQELDRQNKRVRVAGE